MNIRQGRGYACQTGDTPALAKMTTGAGDEEFCDVGVVMSGSAGLE
jgi:hypothetical protein